MKDLNQEIISEFRKEYDFSESSTLEYDNLIGIEAFLLKALQKKDEEFRKVIKGMKFEYGNREFPIGKRDWCRVCAKRIDKELQAYQQEALKKLNP